MEINLRYVLIIALIVTDRSICQKVYSDFKSERLVKLANGNSVFRESHSDGGSLVPGRSSGMLFFSIFYCDKYL